MEIYKCLKLRVQLTWANVAIYVISFPHRYKHLNTCSTTDAAVWEDIGCVAGLEKLSLEAHLASSKTCSTSTWLFLFLYVSANLSVITMMSLLFVPLLLEW